MKWGASIQNRLGLGLLIIVFLLALARVLTMHSAEETSDETVIKISHWQMEAGVREALEEAGKEYAKLHPGVRIEQIIIGERGYASWITTRLIGGTAPDIVAMGTSAISLKDALLQRYFLPLSAEVSMPNPYNKGSALEGIPWKDTYYDAMRGGYVNSLQEYYQVPSSAFSIRLFYNKRKYREITGLDAPPQDFREFLAACEKIRNAGTNTGDRLIPIAGAGKYNAKLLWGQFDQAVNNSILSTTDVNHDGEVSEEESVIALIGGNVDFLDPRLKAMFAGRAAYNQEFQPAFFAADRMDAAFLFLQQKALMIASGTWDAASYARQADFEIGICDLPLPGRDDPDYGKFVNGPSVEGLAGDFSFSVNRLSPNKDVALDFLKFLTSQKINAQLNQRIKWIPIIIGNKPDSFIAPFWPHLEGVKAGIAINSGGPDNLQRYEELVNLHAAGRLNYEEFVKSYTPTYVGNADRWMQVDVPRNAQLAANQDEFTRTAARVTASLSGQPNAANATLLENQLYSRHQRQEFLRRYEEARQHTPLPQPR